YFITRRSAIVKNRAVQNQYFHFSPPCSDFLSCALPNCTKTITKILAPVMMANMVKGAGFPKTPTTAVMNALMPIINEPFIAEAEPDSFLNGDNAEVTVLGYINPTLNKMKNRATT